MAEMSDRREARNGAQHDVIAILLEALRSLGRAGRPVEASRYAARAWSALRHDSPEAAQQFNTLMHYLARLPAEDASMPTTEVRDE